MKEAVTFILICMITSLILVACSTSQNERDTLATEVTTDTFTSQTVDATTTSPTTSFPSTELHIPSATTLVLPTTTPTPTLTNTPTLSPTPDSRYWELIVQQVNRYKELYVLYNDKGPEQPKLEEFDCLSEQMARPMLVICNLESGEEATFWGMTIGGNADRDLLVIETSVKNLSGRWRTFALKDIKMNDSDSQEYEAVGLGVEDSLISLMVLPEYQSVEFQVGPGDTWRLRLLFSIPKDLSSMDLHFLGLPPIELIEAGQ